MPMPVPMPVPAAPAARTVPTVPAAESSGARAPGAPAAVRAAGGPPRWESVRAVMRLELVVWTQPYLVAMIGLLLIVPAAIAADHWLGAVLPLPLVVLLGVIPPFLLLILSGSVCLTLWDPSRSTVALRLYGALPVTRTEVLAGHYLLILAYGGASVLLAAVHLLGAFGAADPRTWAIVLAWVVAVVVPCAVMPPVLARYRSALVRIVVLMGVSVGLGLPVGFLAGSEAVSLASVSQPGTLLGLAVLLLVLAPAALGASWMICRRIYTRQDH
ncbi:ABC-2 transporter permease [Actinomyces bowdenii]|uniref:ABC-2 transporter permease n=1 Tax=Actinomyces bowdenii TaxID=131109 RepID=UPI001ABD47CC|nr:ABC-2 transporter permease [Actinomyces bowdenii]MBO3723516.1 ABC-2 transporter permease [Actinomyces bowdenii]